MSKTLKSLFDELFVRHKLDARFVAGLHQFQVGFVNKNPDHMEFFGGNLTGTLRVMFTPKDEAKFFDEIVKIDPDDITFGLRGVEGIVKKEDGVTPKFEVSSDPFNLTCVYLIHRLKQSKDLSNFQRNNALLDVGLIVNYRFLTGRISWHWKYLADKPTAQAVYAALSQRYLIKKLGTWQKVMQYRAEELIDDEGLHAKTLMNFEPVEAVVQMVNDMQGRIRDMIKNIFDENVKIKAANEKIQSEKSIINDIEGTEIIKDRLNGMETYIMYLNQQVGDKNSFLKAELLDIVMQVSKTASSNNLEKVLTWMSNASFGKHKKIVDNVLRQTIMVSFNYLWSHGFTVSHKLRVAEFLNRLRGCYTSAKSKDPELLDLRDNTADLIQLAIGHQSPQPLASLRTAVLLYIALRAYVKNHYND